MRTTLAVALTVVVVASMVATPAAAGAAPSAPTGSATAQADGTDAEATVATDAERDDTGPAASDGQRDGNHSDACAPLNGGEGREDPEEDQLGWENGCWYDEPLNVDRSDGLNDTELAAVVGRSMARVEQVRELEFEKTVPVEVIAREEYAERISGRYENVSNRERLFHNVLAEARFFAGEDDDWVGTLQELNVVAVGGFYSPTQKRIVVISDNTTSPKMDEITLSQELYHALQDQKFDLTSGAYTESFESGSMTAEDHNRYDAVLEGDGTYVDYLYEQRCNEEWNCLMPEEGGAGGAQYSGGEVGALLTQAVPYSESAGFVQQLHEAEGWSAINALYDNPPASTEQVIHPDKYGEDQPTGLTVADPDSDRWQRLVPPRNGSLGGIPAQNASYGSFGEGGLFAMFFVPSYESRSREIVKYGGFFTESDLEFYDYRSPVTDGWDGDKLVVFVTEDSVETDETAYVWKTAWDSEEDAQQFASAYVALLEYRGADPVEGRRDTYRIPDDREFGDAFYVNHTGTTVTIVNAPSVDELREIRADAASEATPTPSPTATPTEAVDEQTPTPTANPVDEPESPASTTSPGFGPAVALLALAAAALLARRR